MSQQLYALHYASADEKTNSSKMEGMTVKFHNFLTTVSLKVPDL